MRILVFAALLCLVSSLTGGEPFESYFAPGQANGKHYEFRITKADIVKTPIWARDAENPPLSPRRAQEIARKQLDQLLGDRKEWLLREITLAQMGDDIHWVYLVTFEPPPAGHVGEVGPDYMRIIVLMNGTVINPIITPLSR